MSSPAGINQRNSGRGAMSELVAHAEVEAVPHAIDVELLIVGFEDHTLRDEVVDPGRPHALGRTRGDAETGRRRIRRRRVERFETDEWAERHVAPLPGAPGALDVTAPERLRHGCGTADESDVQRLGAADASARVESGDVEGAAL